MVFPYFFRFVRVTVVVIVAVAVAVVVLELVSISLCSEVVVVVVVVLLVVSGGLTSPFSKGAKSRNVGLPILFISKFEERGVRKITTGRTGSVPAERS